MGDRSGINYVDRSYGCWRGCHPVAPGCGRCYAAREMRRYGNDHGQVVRAAPRTFLAPLRWNLEARRAGVRQRVFVTPWSDFWIAEADEWRAEALDIIESCDMLDFVSPSKRLHRATGKVLPANFWPLASVSVQEDVDRVAADLVALRGCRVRGVSYEPALGPVDLEALAGDIDWVIAGCESASYTTPGRPADPEWFRAVRDWCTRTGTWFWLKQMAVDGRLVHMPELDGQVHREAP